MQKNKWIISVALGIAVAGAVIAWLIFGGESPAKIRLTKEVSVQVNSSMRNSVISRERDGKKIWEFVVEQATNDHKKNIAQLQGIRGKIFRSDGSFVEVTADYGTAETTKHDFSLRGNVHVLRNSGGELLADEIIFRQDKEVILARGNVKAIKDDCVATADEVETTTAFKNIKLRGNAKLVKGGR